jgi:glycosyltransferase involved in cell wall biosynthesis
MKKLRHLLLVSFEDPWNPLAWSGIPLHVRLAFEKKVEKLSILGALKPKRSAKDVLFHLMHGRHPIRYPVDLGATAQRRFARQTQKAIDRYKPEAILAISSHCLIELRPPSIPVFMMSDTPWLSWKETYSDFEHMPLLGPSFARREAEAARRCTGLIYPSQWAIEEAKRLYHVPPERLHLQPLGANWTPDLSSDEVCAFIDQRPDDRLDLLFVGRAWERKGGPLAVDIALGLRAAGIPNVRLHIVGCEREPEMAAEAKAATTFYGHLSGGDPEQAALLRRLFLESHYLVMPTRAECYGLVFVEAHAFGLPPVSRAVQAIPSIVVDGQTGVLEPAGGVAESYVRRLLPLVKDRDAYRRMAHAARRRYEENMSWETFAAGVVATIEAAL